MPQKWFNMPFSARRIYKMSITNIYCTNSIVNNAVQIPAACPGHAQCGPSTWSACLCSMQENCILHDYLYLYKPTTPNQEDNEMKGSISAYNYNYILMIN